MKAEHFHISEIMPVALQVAFVEFEPIKTFVIGLFAGSYLFCNVIIVIILDSIGYVFKLATWVKY